MTTHNPFGAAGESPAGRKHLTIHQKTADERLVSRATQITTAFKAFDVSRITLLKR